MTSLHEPSRNVTHGVVAAVLLIVALLVGACGGSSGPALLERDDAASNSISEADAITKADAVLVEQGHSLAGLEASAAEIFGEWQVSYQLSATDTLAGGFLVVLNAVSGELVEVVEYQ